MPEWDASARHFLGRGFVQGEIGCRSPGSLIGAARFVENSLNQTVFTGGAVQVDEREVRVLGYGKKVLEVVGGVEKGASWPSSFRAPWIFSAPERETSRSSDQPPAIKSTCIQVHLKSLAECVFEVYGLCHGDLDPSAYVFVDPVPFYQSSKRD